MGFLIDNHIHGSFGINFNYATYEEAKFVLSELYKRDIRGICPTLVGDSFENLYKQLKIFKKVRDEQLNSINSEALVLGVHLEGTFLSPEKSGIQDKTVFKKPNVENFKMLTKDLEDIIKIVTIAPEEDDGLIEYLNEKNIKTQAGHTLGEKLNGCVATTHQFNAMKSIHHRDSSICLEALVNDEIYCEVIADLVHCSLNILKLLFKAKPKDKILLISDSLPSSNYYDEVVFCGKTINQYGKDKKGTLAGSCKTLDEICFNLVQKGILANSDIEMMAFKNQIKYLNLDKREIDILNR